MPEVRMPLILEDSFVTVPLAREPQRALEDWAVSRSAEVDKVLKRFGLAAKDVRMPTFERMVFEGETSSKRKTSDSRPGGES
jgi:hypothetical protein